MRHLRKYKNLIDDNDNENENAAWFIKGDMKTIRQTLKKFFTPDQYENFCGQTNNYKPVISGYFTRYKRMDENQSGFTYWLCCTIHDEKEGEEHYNDKENAYIAGELYLQNDQLVKDTMIPDMKKYNL
jgi:hypothetical protein